ncbi:DUF1508 domain-containing protein [Candidatus Pacearchaeota archaeon]|nr:DUF1508 domain-containing protein [Candidatus Pacearchaeota archaeon]
MIEYFIDKAGKFRARIRAKNGEIIFSSHQGFTTRRSCYDNLALIREVLGRRIPSE